MVCFYTLCDCGTLVMLKSKVSEEGCCCFERRQGCYPGAAKHAPSEDVGGKAGALLGDDGESADRRAKDVRGGS
jgi:hypothetical protein